MADPRRSLIVMLPADLVDRLDARVAQVAASGPAPGRDDLIADAIERWLRAPPDVGPASARPSADPAMVEAVVRRALDDIEGLAAALRETSARRGRAIDDLAAQLQNAATTCDREGFAALGERIASVQALLRGGVDEALADLTALVEQASALLESFQPSLHADARSRWLSAQAGRGLAPDRVVRGANAIELATGVQASLRAAASEAGDAVKRSRATIEHHADPHAVDATDLQIDADLDSETWSYAAQVAAATVARTLETQRAVIDVGIDHAVAVARTSLELVGAHARQLAEHLADVPDVASACTP